MDKNTLVGFILIGAVIVGFVIYNRPSQEERARAQHYQDSIQQVIKQQQEAQEKQAAAAIEAARPDSTSLFFQAAQGTEQFTVLEKRGRCRDRQDVRRACLYDRSRNERHGAVSVPDRFRRAVPEYPGGDRRGYVEADRLCHGRAIFPCYGQRQPEGDLFRDRPDGEDQDQRTRVQ